MRPAGIKKRDTDNDEKDKLKTEKHNG